MKVFRLELGFQQNEIQHMITKIPKMLTANKRKLTETFDYVHNVDARAPPPHGQVPAGI